jgi:hypothetical protein
MNRMAMIRATIIDHKPATADSLVAPIFGLGQIAGVDIGEHDISEQGVQADHQQRSAATR